MVHFIYFYRNSSLPACLFSTRHLEEIILNQTCLVMLPCSRASMCNRDNSWGMNAFRRGNVTSEKQIYTMNTHAGDHCAHIHRAMKGSRTIQRVFEFVFGPGHLSHEQPKVIHGMLVGLLSAEVIQRPHVLKQKKKKRRLTQVSFRLNGYRLSTFSLGVWICIYMITRRNPQIFLHLLQRKF